MSSLTFAARRAHPVALRTPPTVPATAAPRLQALAAHVLPRGATLSIQDGVGLRLRVVSGEVWITEERSFVDLVIGAGEACPLTRPGRTLVEVRDRARLVLEPASPGATARVVRLQTTPSGPWLVLHRRPGALARLGAALDRACLRAALFARGALRPMSAARARRALVVRY